MKNGRPLFLGRTDALGSGAKETVAWASAKFNATRNIEIEAGISARYLGRLEYFRALDIKSQ